MTDLFREVEEDLRREQYSRLWDKYGLYIVGAAAGIVLIAAAIIGWRAWSHAQKVDASARFDEVARQAERTPPAEAAVLFGELAAEAPGGYQTLARLREAAALLDAGDRAAALAAYESVAAQSGAPEMMRGMARIKAAFILVDEASYDDMKLRLQPLVASASPWRENALELLALSAARAGAWQDVNRNAQAIIDNAASPAGLRDRAHVLQALAAPHLSRAAEQAASAPEAAAVEEESVEQGPDAQEETE